MRWFTTALVLLLLIAVTTVDPTVADLRLAFGAYQDPPSTAEAGSDVAEPPDAPERTATTRTADVRGVAIPSQTDGPCRDLENLLASASADREKCVAAVDAAQCIIATECAGPLSLQLAGLSGENPQLRSRADAALTLLDQASQAAEHGGVAAEEQRSLATRIESLRAFGSLFAALGQPGGGDAASKELLDACNRLAPSLDEPDAELVESAKLWLGFAYRRAGRPDRTLQVVRPIITAPTSRVIGLLARLQRCQALGETGRHAAGIALCERLAVRVDSWLAREDEATRTRAGNTIRYVRIELLQGWAKELRRAGQEDRAAAAEAEATKLRGSETIPPPADRWLALEVAVAGLPERPAPASSPVVNGGD